MTDQTAPGAAAPPPGAQSDPSSAATSAAVAELAALRAKNPGVQFNRLPPSVSALLDSATPAGGATAQAGDNASAPQGPNTPTDTGAQDHNTPADAAISQAVNDFGGDNEPMSQLDAMQARIGLSHQLQVADEIPGLDAGVANQYGKMLAAALENPPTRAQKLAAWGEADRMLRQLHPNGKHEKALADARAELKHLVATRIPDLAAKLERSGGGNDVGVILTLAKRHAQRAGARIASAARGAARR